MLSIGFEIIHVAAFGDIHGIFVFSFLGSALFKEFSCVLNYEVAP